MYLILLCLLAAGPDKDTSDKYLDEDGQLTHTLTVANLQGGVAGPVGDKWAIEPSGAWTRVRVLGKREVPVAKGKLTKKQLAGLAKDLEAYDLAGLKSDKVGSPAANPHLISIEFGDTKAELTLPPGPGLPAASKTKVPGRFAGIVKAVQKRAIPRR
jgi:hypothetical protein